MASKEVDENLILNFGDLPSEGEVFRQKVVFVDVGPNEHEWREVCKFIASLGATLISRVTDFVDFCVFKDGSKATWDACDKFNVPRVRVTYVMECKLLNFLVDMDDFLSPSPYKEEEIVEEKMPSPAIKYRFSPSRACSPLKSDEELEELDVVMRRHMERKSLQNAQRSLLNFDESVVSTPQPIACSSVRRGNTKRRIESENEDEGQTVDKSEEDLFKESDNESDEETALNTRRNAKKSYKQYFNDSDINPDQLSEGTSDDLDNQVKSNDNKISHWRNRERKIDYTKKIFPEVEKTTASNTAEREEDVKEISSFMTTFDGDFEDSLDDDPKKKSFTHRRVVRMQNSQLLTASPICDEEELRIENLRNLGKIRCDIVNVSTQKPKVTTKRKKTVKKLETKKDKPQKRKSEEVEPRRQKIRKRKEKEICPPKEYRRILTAKKHDMSIYDFPNTQTASQQTELVFKNTSNRKKEGDEQESKSSKENSHETSILNITLEEKRNESPQISPKDNNTFEITDSINNSGDDDSDIDFFPSQLAESISKRQIKKSRKNGTLCAPLKPDVNSSIYEVSENQSKEDEKTESCDEDFWSSQLCRRLSSNGVRKSRRNGTLCSTNMKTSTRKRRGVQNSRKAAALAEISAAIEEDNVSPKRENNLRSKRSSTRKNSPIVSSKLAQPTKTKKTTKIDVSETQIKKETDGLKEKVNINSKRLVKENHQEHLSGNQLNRRKSLRKKSSQEDSTSSVDDNRDIFKVPPPKKPRKCAKSSKLPVPYSQSGNSSNDENVRNRNEKSTRVAVRRSTRLSASSQLSNSGDDFSGSTKNITSPITNEKNNVHNTNKSNIRRKTTSKLQTNTKEKAVSDEDIKNSNKSRQLESLNVKLIKRRKRQTISTPPSQSSKDLRNNVVFSSCNLKQQQLFSKTLEKLGKYTLKKFITGENDILVLGNSKRTLKVIQATIYGCPIVSFDWIEKSLSSSGWLDLESFEMKELFQTASRVRCGLTKLNVLFQKAGKIYVSNDTQPEKSELVKLIKLCGGSITENRSSAKVLIGIKNVRGKGNGLSPTWAIDSIMANKLMNINSEYIL